MKAGKRHSRSSISRNSRSIITICIIMLSILHQFAISASADEISSNNNEQSNNVRSNQVYIEQAMNRARELRIQGKLSEALAIYDDVLARDPEYALGHQERGATLAALGKYDDALQAENRAIKLDPDLHLPFVYKGMVYCNKSRFLDAYSEFNRALAIKPDNYIVHMRLGLTSSRLRRNKEALEYYKKASALKPERAAPHRELSGVLIATGDIDSAIYEAEQAVKLERTAVNLNNLAAIYSLINRLKEAKALLEETLERRPDFALASENLGRVLMLEGDYPSAREKFEQAIAIDSNNRSAYMALSSLNNKAILRLRLKSSSATWKKDANDGNSFRPVLRFEVENVDSRSMKGQQMKFRAQFENCVTKNKTTARLRIPGELEPGQAVELEISPRRSLVMPANISDWPRYRCTLLGWVGDVSEYDYQYLLDTLVDPPQSADSQAGKPDT